MIIQRVRNTEHGMFGVMLSDNIPFAVSLEPPWKDNQRNISCIPAGAYRCKRVKSPKYGNVFEITGVQGRSKILIHWGNWVENTDGCVLTGTNYAVIDGKPGVASSKPAFKQFMKKKEHVDEFMLAIIDPPNTSDCCLKISAADIYDVVEKERRRRERLKL